MSLTYRSLSAFSVTFNGLGSASLRWCKSETAPASVDATLSDSLYCCQITTTMKDSSTAYAVPMMPMMAAATLLCFTSSRVGTSRRTIQCAKHATEHMAAITDSAKIHTGIG